jgi:hypothetical protein
MLGRREGVRGSERGSAPLGGFRPAFYSIPTRPNLPIPFPFPSPSLSSLSSPQALFVKYYDTVMPLLYSILVGATDKAHRLLRAKALECISLVAMAVGKDRFREDATRVMQVGRQNERKGGREGGGKGATPPRCLLL